MEKIKITNEKIILKDDKVSCECCGNCTYGCNISIELNYTFDESFDYLSVPTLPPITSPNYYIGRDHRSPEGIGIDLNDYPPEWNFLIDFPRYVVTPPGYTNEYYERRVINPNVSRPRGKVVYPQGFQGSDYSLGRPDNCELCIYNPQTDLWDVIQYIDFTTIWGGEISRPNIVVPFELLPNYIISEGDSCHIFIKLQTPPDSVGSGSPMTWYNTSYIQEYMGPYQKKVIRTVSNRTTTNIMPASDIITVDKVHYNNNGYLRRDASPGTYFGLMLHTSITDLPLISPDFPRTDTIPGQTPSEVPWILSSNTYIAFSREAMGPRGKGTYKIVLESRSRDKLYRPLSVMGHPTYTPNLLPTIKGYTTARILHKDTAELYATNIGTQGDLNIDNRRYDTHPWYLHKCKDSPCNYDGLILKTSPENTSSDLIESITSDFGGTSKSGLPVFSDDGQLMCGPVPTVSHGPLLPPSTPDIEFLSGGSIVDTRDRLNNPITIGPGAVNVGPDAIRPEVLGKKVLVFYAPSVDPETWGRGPNSEARTSRFLKFTTNWEHPDYDVWIEFSGSANALSNPSVFYSADPTIVVIPAGQTIAYTKCPFDESDNFLQPIPPGNNFNSGQTNGLVNGGWTIQFVQGPTSLYLPQQEAFTPNAIFTGDNHSISVEIMSYAP